LKAWGLGVDEATDDPVPTTHRLCQQVPARSSTRIEGGRDPDVTYTRCPLLLVFHPARRGIHPIPYATPLSAVRCPAPSGNRVHAAGAVIPDETQGLALGL